ncbi:MAG: 2-oxo acid dehydrogenase subunit E2 [Thaumarchaeota archaeon]|nr:2-oxo acid dehydrogenase subunit E2 [Candidatus Calditenuaceae archaeon]MDW8187615.1 dihydrolipoamide acetyltransferase family protein [Nitrososphaerota archaeon]
MDVRLPEIGEGVTEAEIVRWLVKEGDHIKKFQPIVEVTTVKVNIEVPSPVEGRLTKILAHEGGIAKVGQVIAVIEEVAAESEVWTAPQPAEASAAPREIAPRRAEREAQREILASPMVRKLARELGVPLEEVRGTGPGGRVTEEDVRRHAELMKPAAAAPAVSTEAEYEEVPFRGVRKAIAEHLTRAARNAVYVTVFDEADVTRLVELRESLKPIAEKRGVRLTYLPFAVRALVLAVKEHPELNSTVDDERHVIRYHKRVNVSVGVHTQDGLIVPVLHGADSLNLFEIASRLAELINRARSRTLKVEEVMRGTIGITNYGAVEGFSGNPVPNYPETAILGTGRIVLMPRVVQGQIVPRHVMPLSLTFDHRVVDGEPAARFLRTVVRYLENPGLLVV